MIDFCKMELKTFFICVLIGLYITSCNTDKGMLVEVDTNQTYQTMHSFGASDAWRCEYVGTNWPDAKKEQIAEWLFSRDFDEQGNPKGIGLSLWRFNIGAGSYEQGDASGITHIWRRAECFLDSNGNYDWSKQAGQQWFLKEAHKYGVDYTLAFTIAAPVQMAENGKAFADKGFKNLNIQKDSLGAYAKFLADVCKHFENQNLGFDYLSPFNEPQWDWNGPSQEGTPASNEDLYSFTKALDAQLLIKDVKSKIAFGEAADIRFLTNVSKGYEDRSNQISTFLDAESPYYIGNLQSLYPVVTGHSYFTTWPIDTLVSTRKALHTKLTDVSSTTNYWQSEFCVLENNEEIGGGNKRDLGMPTALYVARVIHNDITLANASSWQWWTALSQCDYKDGLIYLDNGDSGITDQMSEDNRLLMNDGNYHDSKLMWALGNYSLFVRPGMKRINIKIPSLKDEESEANTLMVSAYKNETKNELVAVVINTTDKGQKIHLQGFESDNEVKTYTTSEQANLAFKAEDKRNLTLKAKSVTTLIFKMKQ
nr:glycoside hydrolase [uncultured Carboxylicivirga sp.]